VLFSWLVGWLEGGLVDVIFFLGLDKVVVCSALVSGLFGVFDIWCI
jgi:hypothetical protein